MKVAIMGAGLSGLSCAITLEKHGIEPVIFESRSQPGDRFVNGEILLSMLTFPVHDCIAYFADTFGIFLSPLANIKKLYIFSEHEKAEIHGNLGFTNLRGRDADSFENQLARQVRSKIRFNSRHTYEELLLDFTHVVMATGDAAYAAKVQDFRTDLTVRLKGAVVTGDFDRYTVAAWLDYNLAPKGYCYFIPLSAREANIVIAYPEYPETRETDIHTLWERFLGRVRHDLGQEPEITDTFEIHNYIFGICNYPRIGNTYFTGNCFGSIMPFLGFGQFVSVLTGVYAAYDLCGLGKYTELTKPLKDSYRNSLALRRGLEKLDNRSLDLLVKGLNGRPGDWLFNSKRYDPLKVAGYLLRPLLKA